MKRLLNHFIFTLVVAVSLSYVHAETVLAVRRSDQFIVHDLRSRSFSRPLIKAPEGEVTVELAPETLLVSADKIREALYSELKITAKGTGKIHISLKTLEDIGPDLTFVSQLTATGWQYYLDVPDRVGDMKLVRGIVQLLLLETANRGTSGKSAEIPLWFLEGVTAHLWASVGPGLVVNAVSVGKMERKSWEFVGLDPMGDTRKFLETHKALSFQELSWPTREQLSGDKLKEFQHSSKLLYHELSRMPNGQANILKMLRDLPFCWNWEVALLRGFAPVFPNMLQVEKWWSVNLVALVSKGSHNASPNDPWGEHLDDILHASVQVRYEPESLPVQKQVPLDELIAKWSFEYQRPIMNQMLIQLVALRATTPPVSIPLIDSYIGLLDSYLQKRAGAGYGSASKREVTVSIPLLVQDTLERLDQLSKQTVKVRQANMFSSSSEPAR